MFAKEMKELMDTLYNIRFPTSVRVNLQNDARITGSILFGFASHSKELIAIGCISVVNRSSQPPPPDTHYGLHSCLHVPIIHKMPKRLANSDNLCFQ